MLAQYRTAQDEALRLAGPEFMRHFQLKEESADLRNSYGGEFGQRCLLARRLVQAGVQHLLLDLPSVDREVDGGVLRAHHAFFGPASSPREGATISELLCVPEGLKAGPGLLAMQVAPFVHDAAPSRPVWFPTTVESHK